MSEDIKEILEDQIKWLGINLDAKMQLLLNQIDNGWRIGIKNKSEKYDFIMDEGIALKLLKNYLQGIILCYNINTKNRTRINLKLEDITFLYDFINKTKIEAQNQRHKKLDVPKYAFEFSDYSDLERLVEDIARMYGSEIITNLDFRMFKHNGLRNREMSEFYYYLMGVYDGYPKMLSLLKNAAKYN